MDVDGSRSDEASGWWMDLDFGVDSRGSAGVGLDGGGDSSLLSSVVNWEAVEVDRFRCFRVDNPISISPDSIKTRGL